MDNFNTDKALAARNSFERILYEFSIPDLRVQLFPLMVGTRYDVKEGSRGRLYLSMTSSVTFATEPDGSVLNFLSPGGLAALPRGDRHSLWLGASIPKHSTTLPVNSLYYPDERTVKDFKRSLLSQEKEWIICLSTQHTVRHLADILPPIRALDRDEVSNMAGLSELVAILRRPEIILNPSNDFLVSRVAAIVAVSMLVGVVNEARITDSVLLETLSDNSMRRAVKAMRAKPEKTWTVDSLAAEAGLGRSHFSVRFKALFGQTPLVFLRNYRLQLAADYLVNQDWTLLKIANEVGYSSEASFSKAFRRYHGAPPAEFRKNKL